MDKKNILKYLRTNSAVTDESILALVDRAADDIEKNAEPKTLYRIFDCRVSGSEMAIGDVRFESMHLADNLRGCKRVVVFGATLGLKIDRMIQSAAATDVALAMAYQAAAAELIEEVCDKLEDEIRLQHSVTLRRRYSPGYFDLDITEQKKLFSLIEITKRIGITLTDSYQMMPSKSVTAFIGIEEQTIPPSV